MFNYLKLQMHEDDFSPHVIRGRGPLGKALSFHGASTPRPTAERFQNRSQGNVSVAFQGVSGTFT